MGDRNVVVVAVVEAGRVVSATVVSIEQESAKAGSAG